MVLHCLWTSKFQSWRKILIVTNTIGLTYTPANRLASASGAWGSNAFSYDAVGNRVNDIVTGSVNQSRVASYGAANNRITGMTENGAAFRSYTYDAGGNIVTDQRPGELYQYTYNKRNRMASVTRNGQAYATYVYNAFEQLASRNTADPNGPVGTVHYIYDLQGHLIAEASAATGATTREYIWLPSNDTSNDTMAEDMGLTPANDNVPDMPLALIEGTTLYQVHTDHLGRPNRITDAAKTTVWLATYKPWGAVQSISGSILNNLRFPGQYFQLETSLAYNWHRTYDPTTGRYTQPDPLRFVDGPSVYAYAGNSPWMRTDTDGRKSLNFGLYGELTPGVGFGAGAGFQIDVPWFGDCTPFDFKLFGSLSGRVGLAASGGVSGGLNTDSKICGCANTEVSIFQGQMEGDLSGYYGWFGVTRSYPIVKGPDNSLDFDTGSNSLNRELKVKIGKDGFQLGAGASAGLGGSGGVSIFQGVGGAIRRALGF